MSDVGTLISEQETAVDLMTRAVINLKKKGNWKTKGNIESRMKLLEERWQEIKDRNLEIIGNTQPSERKQLPYFNDKFMESAYETFADERAKFIDELDALVEERNAASAPGQQATVTGIIPTQPVHKLPSISLPTFSGNYNEWTSFKDRFTSLISRYEGLADIDRFEYLMSCVTGEAKGYIQSLKPIGDS